jgi:hypothetical protein
VGGGEAVQEGLLVESADGVGGDEFNFAEVA